MANRNNFFSAEVAEKRSQRANLPAYHGTEITSSQTRTSARGSYNKERSRGLSQLFSSQSTATVDSSSDVHTHNLQDMSMDVDEERAAANNVHMNEEQKSDHHDEPAKNKRIYDIDYAELIRVGSRLYPSSTVALSMKHINSALLALQQIASKADEYLASNVHIGDAANDNCNDNDITKLLSVYSALCADSADLDGALHSLLAHPLVNRLHVNAANANAMPIDIRVVGVASTPIPQVCAALDSQCERQQKSAAAYQTTRIWHALYIYIKFQQAPADMVNKQSSSASLLEFETWLKRMFAPHQLAQTQLSRYVHLYFSAYYGIAHRLKKLLFGMPASRRMNTNRSLNISPRKYSNKILQTLLVQYNESENNAELLNNHFINILK